MLVTRVDELPLVSVSLSRLLTIEGVKDPLTFWTVQLVGSGAELFAPVKASLTQVKVAAIPFGLMIDKTDAKIILSA